MYIPQKRGYDVEALARKSKGNIERIFAIRHKETGVYFRSHKGSTTSTTKPFLMSKAVSSYYFNEFLHPEDWEVVEYEAKEKTAAHLSADELNTINNAKSFSQRQSEKAFDILWGNRENYDGADCARNVAELCDVLDELVELLIKKAA